MTTFEIGVSHRSRPHLLADLVELILAVKYDNVSELSQAAFQIILKEMPGADDDNSANDALTDAQAKDNIELALEDCWNHLEYRQAVFGKHYPFHIDGDRLLWRRAKPTLDCQMYLFLRLRSFTPQRVRGTAASAFVGMCREAMRALATDNANVRIFDANSDDRKSHYGTDLRKALRVLARELAAHQIHEVEIDKASSSGDARLDIIASYGFNDPGAGTFSILAQCAARETEWPSKTLEASPRNLLPYFTLLNNPENLLFIPVCFRTSTGDWVRAADTNGCILIDRVRILELLSQRGNAARTQFKKECSPILETLSAAA